MHRMMSKFQSFIIIWICVATVAVAVYICKEGKCTPNKTWNGVGSIHEGKHSRFHIVDADLVMQASTSIDITEGGKVLIESDGPKTNLTLHSGASIWCWYGGNSKGRVIDTPCRIRIRNRNMTLDSSALLFMGSAELDVSSAENRVFTHVYVGKGARIFLNDRSSLKIEGNMAMLNSGLPPRISIAWNGTVDLKGSAIISGVLDVEQHGLLFMDENSYLELDGTSRLMITRETEILFLSEVSQLWKRKIMSNGIIRNYEIAGDFNFYFMYQYELVPPGAEFDQLTSPLITEYSCMYLCTKLESICNAWTITHHDSTKSCRLGSNGILHGRLATSNGKEPTISGIKNMTLSRELLTSCVSIMDQFEYIFSLDGQFLHRENEKLTLNSKLSINIALIVKFHHKLGRFFVTSNGESLVQGVNGELNFTKTDLTMYEQTHKLKRKNESTVSPVEPDYLSNETFCSIISHQEKCLALKSDGSCCTFIGNCKSKRSLWQLHRKHTVIPQEVGDGNAFWKKMDDEKNPRAVMSIGNRSSVSVDTPGQTFALRGIPIHIFDQSEFQLIQLESMDNKQKPETEPSFIGGRSILELSIKVESHSRLILTGANIFSRVMISQSSEMEILAGSQTFLQDSRISVSEGSTLAMSASGKVVIYGSNLILKKSSQFMCRCEYIYFNEINVLLEHKGKFSCAEIHMGSYQAMNGEIHIPYNTEMALRFTEDLPIRERTYALNTLRPFIDFCGFIRKIKNIKILNTFVKSVGPEFWNENPQVTGQVYDEYCRLSTDSTEFGTDEFWKAVLGDMTDMVHTSQPTGQASPTAQATAVDDTTVQAPAVDNDTTVQAPAVEDDTTVQAPAIEDDTTVQASAEVDTLTAQAPAAEEAPETRDWLTSQEFDAMFGAGAGDAVPAQQVPLPLSHYFTLTYKESVKIKKFGIHGQSFKLNFRNLDEVDDVEDLLNDVLQYLIQKMKDEKSAPGTLMGVSIDHPSMDSPFLIPFHPIDQLTPEVILRTIMKILQSNKDVALDSDFEVKFTTVIPPSGSGDGKRKFRNNWEEWKKYHTGHGGCFIAIKNQDHLCCARALVVAKAKVDQEPRFNLICLDETTRHQEQRRRAQDLMREAGLERHQGPCGVPELKAIQEVLSPDYQIKVFWKEGFNQIIFKGPQAPKILSLYLYDNHYDVITSVPGFFDQSFYCHACDAAYHRKNGHRCQEACKACYESRTCTGDVVHCQDCNRFFSGQECFDTHKTVTVPRGNKRERRESSVCTRVKRCPTCSSQYVVGRGAHKCGKFWCPSCSAWVEKKDHSCHIQPLKETEPQHETLIFFDFETSQEVDEAQDDDGSELRTHKVNACVAQKVCTDCRDEALGHCPKCGQNEMTFDGPDTLEKFCRWLFSETNRGSVAMAHNSQAFDSQFILNYLHKQAVKPQVITRGLKILSLQVNGLKIIDSLSFLPMPLSALPKAFNLTELKKGYFPHLFNTAANWDYIGPMPDASFYDPDNMKPGPRASFEAWYEENKTKNFDFKKELMEYCTSDVDILRKACLSFQKAFHEQTKVNPFESAITIAQACQFVYRQNYLQPNTIALIPHGGYRWKDRFSVTAIKWLKWKSHQENIQIRHAVNGGEVKVGRFKVDGIAGNRVFEFNGCQFHGCPNCFPDRTLKLPLAELTAQDAYTRTVERRLYIESQGYAVEELWGCQLDEELRQNIEMRDFFKNINITDPLDPREAFYGGRTNAVMLYYKAKPDEKINYADVCSLYPYICKYGKFPTGHPTIITEGFEPIERKTYEGLIKCRVLPPRRLYLPVLPYRYEQKLIFPLCRSCLETREKEACHHTDDERALEGAWISDELYKAIDSGYKILEVKEVWHYPTIQQYDGENLKDTLFGEYIDSFLKLKTEASGWPKCCKTEQDKEDFIRAFEEKEKIKLDSTKIKRNEAYRALAKLMLNSFWGKFAQGDNLSKTEYFLDPSKFFELVLNPSNVISTVKPINNDLVLVTYTKEENFIRTKPNTSVVVAAYVTAQARLKLYSYLEKIPKRVLYMDTDSVVYVSRPTDTYDLPTGSFMGDLTDELSDYGPGSYISEFVSGGPKNYAFKVVTPGKEMPSFVTKVRGFTLTSTVSNLLNFESLKMRVHAFVESDRQEKFKVFMRKINRKEDHSVVTEYVSKTYQVVYDKRVVKPDFSTLPYGY